LGAGSDRHANVTGLGLDDALVGRTDKVIKGVVRWGRDGVISKLADLKPTSR
jgi:hypothetical protein